MSAFRVQFDGNSYDIPDECPHRGGRLRYGAIDLQRGVVICPLHFSTFDIRTGCRLSGPACENLAVTVVAKHEV